MTDERLKFSDWTCPNADDRGAMKDNGGEEREHHADA
jgi:hypothetical protein